MHIKCHKGEDCDDCRNEKHVSVLLQSEESVDCFLQLLCFVQNVSASRNTGARFDGGNPQMDFVCLPDISSRSAYIVSIKVSPRFWGVDGIRNFVTHLLTMRKMPPKSLTFRDCNMAPQFRSEDTIVEVQSIYLSDQCTKRVHVQNYWDLKRTNRRWVSKALSTIAGYKYTLVVRPNGLKYAEGYGSAVGVWLNPICGNKDDLLVWPAEVQLSLKIEKGVGSDIVIAMTSCEWEQCETTCPYPAFYFDLTTFTHAAIETECVIDGVLTILIDEKVTNLCIL